MIFRADLKKFGPDQTVISVVMLNALLTTNAQMGQFAAGKSSEAEQPGAEQGQRRWLWRRDRDCSLNHSCSRIKIAYEVGIAVRQVEAIYLTCH